MPWQEAASLEHGPWEEIPGLFLPSKILDLCFCTIPTPPSDIAQLVSLLAWTILDETKEYYAKLEAQVKGTLEADHQREVWKHHSLYKHKKKELEKSMSRTENNCTTFSNKTSTYNSKQQGDAEPTGYVPYSGKVTNIPTRVTNFQWQNSETFYIIMAFL